MAIDPRLEPGRVIYYPCKFDPLSARESPHYIVLADRTETHFLYFAIVTEPSPYQETNEEALKHFVAIAKDPDHKFLDHNSLVWCGQLHVERVYNIVQHIRERPRSIKGKISNQVRQEILKIMSNGSLKLLSEKQRQGVLNYLG